jgi:hypothetical protein
MKVSAKPKFMIMLAIILLLAIGVVLAIKPTKRITNFQECIDAGYPTQESYPAVCRTPDGRSFTQPTAIPLEPIMFEAARDLIKRCQADGTYSLHSGELGLTLKNGQFQPVHGATEDELKQQQNPACPFNRATIE